MTKFYRPAINLHKEDKTLLKELLAELEKKAGRFIGISRLIKCLLKEACKTNRKQLIKRLADFA
jgi:hypothetical protein